MDTPNRLTAVPNPTGGRILEMDALRGLAAVAVVLFHYTTRYDELFGHASAMPFSLPYGFFGVDLFFMLSGFVILMTLQRTPSSLKFAWGRFSRLYPTYWAAALLTFVVVSIFGLPGQEVSPVHALVNVTMLQGLLRVPHIDGAYWSLQAELIFYLNMLLLYRLGCFRRPEWTVIVWVGLGILLGLLLEPLSLAFPIAGLLLSKFITISSLKFIPLFAIGIVIFQSDKIGKQTPLSLVAIATCCFAIFLTDGIFAALLDASLAGVLAMAIGGRLRFLSAGPFVWLGAISYSLYLVHQNIGYIIIRSAESVGVTPMIAVLIASTATLMIAAAMHYGVERPSMNYLRNVDLRAIGKRWIASRRSVRVDPTA